METIGKREAKVISEAIAQALESVEQELGVKIEVGGGTFDPTVGTFKPKITVSVDGAAKNAFAQDAAYFKLTADDYEREFTSHGKTYKLVGVKPRSPKYPLIGEAADGRQYKFTDAILPQFGVRIEKTQFGNIYHAADAA